MVTVRTHAASGLSITFACALAVALAGCSSVGADSAAAGSAARRFHEALDSREPAAACGLLAPETLREVEQSAKSPCPKALAEAGLPHADTVTTSDVYGANARVILNGDTVFLARFGRQWKVTAAGCKPRPGRPYDCDVKGS